MPKPTAGRAEDYDDRGAAQSALAAVQGAPSDSAVTDDESRDTIDEETTDDITDSDESPESPEATDEDTDSEEVETPPQPEDTLPFTAADMAAIAADPKLARMAKGMQAAYTKRMQQLGEVERFSKALQGNPAEVIARLAKQYGVEIAAPKAEKPAEADPADPVESVVRNVHAKWTPIIGEAASQQILAGIREVVQAATGAAVQPVVSTLEQRDQAALQQKYQEEFATFEKEHPDWKQHEAKMAELLPNINPNLSPYKAAKLLYQMVTADAQASRAKNEGAQAMAAKVAKAKAAAEPVPRTRIPGAKVKAPAPKFASDRDAILAALEEQGIST